jgi:hypothetical protein
MIIVPSLYVFILDESASAWSRGAHLDATPILVSLTTDVAGGQEIHG